MLTTPRTLSPLDLVTEIAERYRISALSGLLGTVRESAGQDEIGVALLGRFKAGKSSFLNHFLGNDVLPVGVVPVTAVVTEILYGPRKQARVHHRNGACVEVALEGIGIYISEKENPKNEKQAGLITVELPELRRFRGLKFVDTPGLESALEHNTQTSLAWLPNVGLALVAVSVDLPLSGHEIELLKHVYRYTPRVAVLLTKADLLSGGELAEVVEFVRAQLSEHLASAPPVFPYSVKPGFERFREGLEQELTLGTLRHLAAERRAIHSRKLDNLMQECAGYLALSLKSAESQEADWSALSRQVLGEREAIDDLKSMVRLIVRNAAAGTRSMAAHLLEAHQSDLERRLLADFESEFPRWRRNLATILSFFEDWLASALHAALADVSDRERSELLAPLDQVCKRVRRALQQFRDHLSDSTLRVFGVPLRTSEPEVAVKEPATPDIRVGRVFDRDWELLSPILPVWMIEGAVCRHFRRTISYLIYENLSRLAAQWEEGIQAALRDVEIEAGRRLDELLVTVERLLKTGGEEQAPQLRADLARLELARQSVTGN